MLEKELVHTEFYNGMVKKAERESKRRDIEDKKIESEYLNTVDNFEERIDFLRKINEKSEKFIKENHGDDTWDNLIK